MTSKKSILIVGTSHTAGQCTDPKVVFDKEKFAHFGEGERKLRWQAEREAVNKHWLEPQNRWWGGLYDKYDVTTFCQPGATAQGQFYYLAKWLDHNPDLRFDGAIIEGRLPPCQSIAFPAPTNVHDKEVTTEEEFLYWTHRYPINSTETISKWKTVFQYLSHGQIEDKEWRDWYEHYQLYDDLIFVDIVSANIAMCKLLEKRCTRVGFTSYQSLGRSPKKHHYLLELLKQKWGVTHLWPSYRNNMMKTGMDLDAHNCPCGHMNATGNAIIQSFATEHMERHLGFIE